MDWQDILSKATAAGQAAWNAFQNGQHPSQQASQPPQVVPPQTTPAAPAPAPSLHPDPPKTAAEAHVNAHIDSMIADVIKKEGGYNDTAGDAGGATNLGISLKYLKGVGLLRGDLNHDGDITKDDIRLVTPAIAAALYKEDFFTGPHIDTLPEDLQPVIFDIAVNSGPPRAIILLQKVLRAELGVFIPADGVMGPQTRTNAENAVNKFGTAKVVNAVVDARNAWYHAIVAEDPTQQKFLKGWLARSESFRVS